VHRAIDPADVHDCAVNPTFLTAAPKACFDPTAFAAWLEISANLRKPAELTNPPVEECRQ